MAWRWPLAVLLACPVFIGLMGLWLHTRWKYGWDGIPELPLPNGGQAPGGATAPAGVRSADGGVFGGGGASAAWDASPAAVHPAASPQAAHLPAAKRLAEEAPPAPDAPSAFNGLLSERGLLGLLAGAVLVLAYGLYATLVLLAEVVVDGALSWALLSRVLGLGRRNWVRGLLRLTWGAFAVTALVLALAGGLLQPVHPLAHTLGQALHPH